LFDAENFVGYYRQDFGSFIESLTEPAETQSAFMGMGHAILLLIKYTNFPGVSTPIII